MASDIVIAGDLWDGDEQAVVTNWFASDGATVTQGMLLAEIMVAKTQFEVRAPADGVLTIVRNVDDIVSKGDVVGRIA